MQINQHRRGLIDEFQPSYLRDGIKRMLNGDIPLSSMSRVPIASSIV
jgi:hypothetical protein